MKSPMAIFPLPGLVLFPGTYLPLHIFEPRYRLMLEYCIESDYEIGITSLNRDNSIDLDFGWGKVIKRDQLPDGRSNIVIEGVGVAKLIGYESKTPFIIALVEKEENNIEHLEDISFRDTLKEVIYLTKTYLYKVGVEKSFIFEMDRLFYHPFPLDFIASILNISYEQKKDILLAKTSKNKAEQLLQILERINH